MTDEYEPAPVEQSLAAARGILARLFELPLLEVASEGPCADCKREEVLFVIGRLGVCRLCATSRQRAGKIGAESVIGTRQAEAS
jgi:hypothetical protein